MSLRVQDTGARGHGASTPSQWSETDAGADGGGVHRESSSGSVSSTVRRS